jgi:hypothetical protein
LKSRNCNSPPIAGSANSPFVFPPDDVSIVTDA